MPTYRLTVLTEYLLSDRRASVPMSDFV